MLPCTNRITNLEELLLRLLHDVELAAAENVQTDRQQTLEALNHCATRMLALLAATCTLFTQ